MRTNLCAAEQVAYLRDKKDVAFDLMSEEDAARFLSERNYFFKVKAFAKNYDKRFKEGDRKGRYIGLDFAHLVELTRIDRQMRDLVLRLTLDIEHYLRVRINRSAMREGADPSALAEQFLAYSSENAISGQVKSVDAASATGCFEDMRTLLDSIGGGCDAETVVSVANELEGLLRKVTEGRDPDHVRSAYAAMGSSPYSRGIVEKYGETGMPYWCLMELISFGPLIKFYRSCFRKGGFLDDPAESRTLRLVNNFFRRAQTLRNAAAHGDCLLNGLSSYSKSKSTAAVKRELQRREGLEGDVVNQVSSVTVAMDLAAVLMCYDVIVPAGRTRSDAAGELRSFSERVALNREWFSKNYSIRSFMDYIELVMPHFADKFEGAHRAA